MTEPNYRFGLSISHLNFFTQNPGSPGRLSKLFIIANVFITYWRVVTLPSAGPALNGSMSKRAYWRNINSKYMSIG
jgi:hypothetical protein